MINVNEFKPGVTFEYKDKIYIVLESIHSKSGRGQAHVKVKAKNLIEKTILNITFIGGEKVKKAFIEAKNAQFLYFDKIKGYFMDLDSFEQIEISNEKLEKEKKFLVSNLIIKLKLYKNIVFGIDLPLNITLIVTEAPDAVRGDTITNPTKKVTVETGFKIDVPQFISTGDKIVVNSETEKYVSRR